MQGEENFALSIPLNAIGRGRGAVGGHYIDFADGKKKGGGVDCKFLGPVARQRWQPA